jgi:hypothetical protein
MALSRAMEAQMPHYSETFPDWLAARMAERDLHTSGAVSDYTGAVSPYTAGEWRRGHSRPSPRRCALIAEAFAVPLAEVLEAVGY